MYMYHFPPVPPAKGPNDYEFELLTDNLRREGKGDSLTKSIEALDVERFVKKWRSCKKPVARLLKHYDRDILTKQALKACKLGHLSTEEVATISYVSSHFVQISVNPTSCPSASTPDLATPTGRRMSLWYDVVSTKAKALRDILRETKSFSSLRHGARRAHLSAEAKHYLLPTLGIEKGSKQARELLKAIADIKKPWEDSFTVFNVLDGDVSQWSPMLKRITEVFKLYNGKNMFAPVKDINCQCENPYYFSFHCTRIVVPSASILQIWLNIMCGPDAPKLRWVFGKVTDDDVQKLAILNERPIQLHHELSHLAQVPDGYPSGDGVFSTHDIYHAARIAMQSPGVRPMYQRWVQLLKGQPDGEEHAQRIGDGQLAMTQLCQMNPNAESIICGHTFHNNSNPMPKPLRKVLLKDWAENIDAYKETFGVDSERVLCADCATTVKKHASAADDLGTDKVELSAKKNKIGKRMRQVQPKKSSSKQRKNPIRSCRKKAK